MRTSTSEYLEYIIVAKDDALKKLGTTAEASNTKLAKLGKAAGIAGFAIAGGLAVGIGKSVKAAMAAQVSQERLRQSFIAAHQSLKPYQARLEELEKAGRKLGFTDEAQKEALGSLMVATHSYTRSAKLMSTAEDIARFKHIDLASATKMMTMAMAGSQRATKQLGLTVQADTTEVDKLKHAHDRLTPAQKLATDATYKHETALAKQIDKQTTANKVIALVTQHLHGQADAYSNTAAGGMEQFRAQMEHLKATMGEKLLPALTKVLEKLTSLIDYLGSHPKVAEALAIGLGLVATAMLAVSVATFIATAAESAFLLPVLAIIAAVALLGAGLIYAYTHFKTFRSIVDGVMGFMRDHWRTILLVFISIIFAIPAALIYAWTHFKTFRDVVTGVFNAVKSASAAALGWLQSQFGLVGDAVGAVITAFKWVHEHGAAVWKDVKSASAPALALLTKAFGLLADALGKVQGAFKWIVDNAKAIGGFFGGLVGGSNDWADKAKAKAAQGDAAFAGMGWPGGGGSFPSSISPRLYDEISGGYHFGLGITSGYRPGARTKHGTRSDHSIFPSHAVDMAGAAGSMAGFFRWLVGQSDVKQAFYDPLGSIFNGRWSPYREGGHSDHVHVATYDRGGYLPPGLTLALNKTGRPERVVGPGDDVGRAIVFEKGAIVVEGSVVTENDLVRTIHEGLRAAGRRNNGTGL